MNPEYGMFGNNYQDIEREVIAGLREANKKSSSKFDIFKARITKKPIHHPPIDIVMYDLNPKVFGPEGMLFQYLKEEVLKNNDGRVRLIAKKDSSNVVGSLNEIGVDMELGDHIGDSSIFFEGTLYTELIYSRPFVALYSQKANETIFYFHPSSVYQGFDQLFNNLWNELRKR